MACQKTEIDERILRMWTREGFTELFWEELRERKEQDDKVTYEDVFNELNNLFYQTVGSYRYSDYKSFQRWLNKKR